MAETSPLVSAHAHARKAAEETGLVHWSRAADEHLDAAAGFAKAARGTSDNEALRVLKLLEEQHFRLAQIIRTQESSTAATDARGESPAQISKQETTGLGTAPENVTSSPSRPGSTTAAIAHARAGSHQHVRNSSPSLAREIASRRGIPPASSRNNPPSAAAQARARQLSPESLRRNRSSNTSNLAQVPPSIIDSHRLEQDDKARRAKQIKDEEHNDAFAKFYTNLTTGTVSKLSSMLAYAGLPLTADDIIVDEQPSRRNSSASSNVVGSKQTLDHKRTVSAGATTDVKKIFSRAALDAIEDEHRRQGTQGHIFGPAESFYVVQKGGGTYSYAEIAKAHQQDGPGNKGQHLSGIEEDDDDDFVDAREAPGPSNSSPNSPRQSRIASTSSTQPSSKSRHQHMRSSFGKSRTHEELELENATLKQTLEQLANRLTDFETHAQDASMAALTHSMASLPGGGAHHPLAHHLQGKTGQLSAPPAASPQPSLEARAAAKADQERLKLLERKNEEFAEKVARQEKILRQYKAKWEDLKSGAKARREQRANSVTSPGGASPAGVGAALPAAPGTSERGLDVKDGQI